MPSLAGQYEFVSKLGEGGMGVVYKARHLALNQFVAIKMLHLTGLDQTKLLRFQQEARAVNALDHPSIVRVRDFGVSEGGQPHMVLDFIDGVTLEGVLKSFGPLSL
jgi:serine/threonine-protein kinase